MKKIITNEEGKQVEVDVTYKNITLDDIIQWCQENGEDKVAWLKDIAAKPVKILDENKKPVLDEDGNPKTRELTFIDLKLAFVEKFMTDLAPKRQPKKASMFERIKAL